MTPVDSWEMGTGGSLHRASSQELCFYARLSDAAAPNPSNTSLPEHEVRCIKFQNQRLEVETAELTYDAQVTRMLGRSSLKRVLGRNLDSIGFSYDYFPGVRRDLRDVSLIKLTLMHSGVVLRPNAATRGMSATVAVRANRFSPLQTPLFTKPGQVTSLVLTATEQTITLTWNAPSPDAGGAPTEYHVRWKSGDQSYPSGPSSDRYEVVTGATTLEITGLTTCVASDFARRDPGSFRLHLRWLLALIMEAINDDIDTAEAEADADSRAEVRLVAADADGADLPGRRGSRGWGGPVGDHRAASSCPRWSDRGAAGVEGGPAASVSPGGVGGRGVAGRGRPAPGDGGRAGRRVGGAAGKIALGMSGPVPARVDGTAKAALLSLVDDAVDAGWTLNRACAVVELDRGRAWRWQQRRAGGGLDDARPGGNPIHGLLEWEEAEILALFDEWGDVDRSHRKLAHRGCCEQRVWASPSTVDRVLARHGLALQGAPRPARTVKTPWPHWCEWHPNQLWCWDGSQFERCVAAKHAYAIVDLVSRKWISTRLTANPDSVAARVLFSRGLDNEGLLTDELRARLTDPDTGLPDGDQAPLLLAVSDNGTEMHANETRRFMALCSIAQHFGRPSTPTDQAWIESLWGHVKREHPHLTTITDPAVLAAELERVRVHHNSVRLHEAIGYVTPNDEHDGRGDTIRAARTDGMRNADEQRRAWHRSQR